MHHIISLMIASQGQINELLKGKILVQVVALSYYTIKPIEQRAETRSEMTNHIGLILEWAAFAPKKETKMDFVFRVSTILINQMTGTKVLNPLS